MSPLKRTPDKPWNLADALDLIRILQPELRKINYHCLLGGGVLNRGESEKDLDLFFCPLNGSDSKPFAVMEVLYTMFGHGEAIRDSPDYDAGEPWHWHEMFKYDFGGRRIDVFIQ